MRLIHKLRCSLDPAYRIKVGFGLDPVRNNRELEALIEFCRETHAAYIEAEFKGGFMNTWLKTVKLYDQYELTKSHRDYHRLIDYIKVHCGEYWS